jgi:wobble nucleotide-excising tRNase
LEKLEKMIQHFEKIENLGVFANYKEPKDLNSFQRFNLIYGMNGSGKTTLSRFFADLNEGKAAGFPDLKYKIKTEDGEFVQGKPYTRQIRVFNAEYVEENIGAIEGTLNPIFVLGADNKALADKVKVDEEKLEALEIRRSEKETEFNKEEKSRGKIFTNIAKEISNAAKGATIRAYTKKNAESVYDKTSVFTSLDLKELAAASSEMNQSAMDRHAEYLSPSIDFNGKDQPVFAALQGHCDNVQKITLKSATSIAIERLTTNIEVAEWVEQGMHIHTENDCKTCEYCLQKIPEARKEELAAHFNDSDSLLKKEVEDAIAYTERLAEKIEEVHDLDSKLFYPELRPEHENQTEILTKQRSEVIAGLKELTNSLQEKLTRRTESYVSMTPSFTGDLWDETVSKLNDVIQRHNSESDNFETRKQDNFEKIEAHFLNNINPNVKEADAKIARVKAKVDECNNGNPKTGKLGLEPLKKLIKDNRAKIANSHQAATELSKKLSSFLGRDDLKFEPEGEGYRITRFGRAAKRLSEGEKTAITFLYFVVGLTDQDFDLAKGIVVIDDPISSLDSNSVYQAFAYLKNAVKDAKQVFLFTHNFEFLKLLLDWLTYGAQKDKTYWMLHCSNSGAGVREAEIKPLDDILIKNRNEFVFLFKTLVDFKSDGTISTSYPIPNIVRKVLETFLAQHSTGSSFYKRLENLEYDEAKKTALYKYTNDLSHPTLTGLDPALVGETQTNVKHLLEMIKAVAPVHYSSLTKTIAV